MSWTIAQLLAIPVDEVPIQEPIEGTVKLTKDVTTHEEYGDSQFFVLEDATGEIGVMWSVGNPKDKLDPVQKNDRVRIQATEYKGRLTGAKKQVYTKGNEKKSSIKVSGNRLTNLSRSPEPASRPVQTPHGVTLPAYPGPTIAGLFPAPISEQEAVDAYWRVFERQAAKLSRYMSVDSFEQFMDAADPADMQLCHSATAEVFRGILAGRVTPDTRREPPKQQARASGMPHEDDPFEGLDDGDIPFALFLPFLLPLLYFAATGGVA